MKFNKNALKRIYFGVYKFGLRLGFHLLPDHYYVPLPNILELEKNKAIWAKRSDLPGIFVDLEEQASNLKQICLPYNHETEGNKTFLKGTSKHFGPGFGYIEARALHAVIRYYKPKLIVEVGSGVSTYCMLKACEINERETGQIIHITAIEPHPSEKLKSLSEVHLIPSRVQTVPMDVFTQLGSGDLLFIDSSHTVKAGGDVNYLILEVLPRLKSKVIVHIHDINLPYDYRREVLSTFMHWAETSLLRGFLINNNKARILFCMSHLHYDRKDVLKEVFPDYTPQDDDHGLKPAKYKPFESISEHFPSSIYIEIV